MGFRQIVSHMDRHLGEVQLRGSLKAGMADDYDPRPIDDDGQAPAELGD